MCGIFGRVGPPSNSEYDAASLAHRGPDDFGSYAAPIAGTPSKLHLAHRRLSIIDLSPCGHQPMSNEDGSIWIVFNGEIYNFIELRSQLIQSGHQFRSRTDTETIIHGYEQWGDAVVDRLRGMFAFGLWDGRRNRLLLARDRVGKKPLFYALTRDRLLFGSEIKALLATGELDTQPDALALHDYLTYLYFPPPRTAYKSISKLPPASCMAVEVSASGALETRQWSFWDAAEAASVPQNGSERQLIGRARELIDEAVRVRLISDVPLGVFLSGGIDSSTITAVTSKRIPGKVKTFTISFPEDEYYNEVDAAGEVSRALRTEHHILPAASETASYLSTVIRHFDEPFGNPTAILQYILAKLTRPYVTVALSGEGGDELFGGYPRYLGANLARHYRNLPRFVTRGLVARLADLLGETTDGRHGLRRAREFAHFAWQPEEDMYLHWLGYFTEEQKRELYTPEFASAVGEYESGDFLRQLFRRGAHLEPLSRLSYVDICSFLTCNLLEYSDRMSMANSLEVRCPYTDSKLIEFALGLPAEMKLRGRRGKWIITEAFRGELPTRILERGKVGFNPPVGQWLKSELKPMLEDYLGESRVLQRGMFRPQAITRLISEHQSGKRDNSLKIWALFALEEWMRMYIDHRTAPDDVMTRERVGAA